jgi:hypothetical protein
MGTIDPAGSLQHPEADRTKAAPDTVKQIEEPTIEKPNDAAGTNEPAKPTRPISSFTHPDQRGTANTGAVCRKLITAYTPPAR